MGACQNKELFIVCSCNCADDEVQTEEQIAPEEEELIAPLPVKGKSEQAAERSLSSKLPEFSGSVEPSSATNAAAAEDTSSPAPKVPVASQEVPPAVVQPHEEVQAPPMLELIESLHLTGNFAEWATDFAPCTLRQVPSAKEGAARLRTCVKLTSQSFSFQVVCKQKQWNWRLYPRDAKPIRFTHASKEGRLKPGEPEAVVVGLGDLKAGHGLNFHVIEEEYRGSTVTIWVEVPVKASGGGVALRTDTVQGAKVWFTMEDTGVQYKGGDGVDLNKYKWMKIG